MESVLFFAAIHFDFRACVRKCWLTRRLIWVESLRCTGFLRRVLLHLPGGYLYVLHYIPVLHHANNDVERWMEQISTRSWIFLSFHFVGGRTDGSIDRLQYVYGRSARPPPSTLIIFYHKTRLRNRFHKRD